MASRRARNLDEDAEAREERCQRVSDASRIRTSYRYTIHGKPVPEKLKRRESKYWRGEGLSSRSTASPSASSSHGSAASPSAQSSRLTMSGSASSYLAPVKMEVDAPVPAFAPGEYVDDADIDKTAAQLAENDAGFVPGDFIDDKHLPTVCTLVSDRSRREHDKKMEWEMVAEEQKKVFVELDSDEE